jgi:hypothetical protein
MAPYDPMEWGIRTNKKAIKELIKKGISRSDAKKKVTPKYIEQRWKTHWVIKYLKEQGIPRANLPKVEQAWRNKVHRDCRLAGCY